MLSSLLFEVSIAAAGHVVLVRLLIKVEDILRDLLQFNDTGVVGTEKVESSTYVRRNVSSMLLADNSGLV